VKPEDLRPFILCLHFRKGLVDVPQRAGSADARAEPCFRHRQAVRH
jgi:hypothetical protein